MKRFNLIHAALAAPVFAMITWVAAGHLDASEEIDRLANADSSTAELIIDFGDGFQHRYTELPCAESATVWDLMQAAKKHPRTLDFRHRGRGTTLLVLAIAGVENGAGADSKNWIYRVNGEIGNRSVGVQSIKPGDTVLWRFEQYR